MRIRCYRLAAAAIAGWFLFSGVGAAGALEVRTLIPAGGQRGATVDVTVAGKFDQWPAQVWADAPGLTISAAEEKGKFRIAVAADAQPGLRWLRVYDASGVSTPQPFVVGMLPEVSEVEPNNGVATAQPLNANNLVVNGRLGSNGDVDLVALPLAAGQTLVASLAAHEGLASPVDAVLHVLSADGYQLAYNHDGRGLDPELAFTAPTTGTYLVRVFGFPSNPNSTIGFSGGERHLYRLTLSTAGFVDYVWPLAIQRNQPTTVTLHGWNIPAAIAERQVTANDELQGELLAIADERLANVATVRAEPHAAIVEVEPNDSSAPQAVTLPVTISGRIGEPGDVDIYQFSATKGQSIEFTLESRSLGYPLDGLLQIHGADGRRLARIDDAGSERDPTTVFAPPADGTYQLHVSDLNRFGSQRHVYRLRAVPVAPDVVVSAGALAYAITGDQTAEVTLTIERRHGFAEELEFHVTGLPEFVSASPARSLAEGETAKAVKLTLKSSGGEFAGPIHVEARSTSSELQRLATAAIADHTARLADLWLTVRPAESK